MSVDAALARLAQCGEATHSSDAERSLHQIALTLAGEVRRLRAGTDSDVQYAIRADGVALSHRTGADWGGAEVAQQDTEDRLERYRDCWPDAVMVRRAVRYGPWEVVPRGAGEPAGGVWSTYVLAEADAPADRLAASLAADHPDLVGSEGIDDQTLRLRVRPESVDRWQWWLDAMRCAVDDVTHHGTYATARGHRDGVGVVLVGEGVPALARDAMREMGGASGREQGDERDLAGGGGPAGADAAGGAGRHHMESPVLEGPRSGAESGGVRGVR